MLEAIGARALDPYAALCLDPLAPPTLVMAMYRMLTERALAGPETSLAVLALLRESYGALADARPEQRAHADGERRVARNHYQALGVAIDADAEAIDLARAVGMRTGDAAQRERIGAAHRTLSNPYLRARYDASLVAPVRIVAARLSAPQMADAPEAPLGDAALAFERRMMHSTLVAGAMPVAAPCQSPANADAPDLIPAGGDAARAATESRTSSWASREARKDLLARLKEAESENERHRITAPAPPPATTRAPTQPRSSDPMTARLLELAPAGGAPSILCSEPPSAPADLRRPPIRWAILAADD